MSEYKEGIINMIADGQAAKKEHTLILSCKSCNVNMGIDIDKIRQTLVLKHPFCNFCEQPLLVTIGVKA